MSLQTAAKNLNDVLKNNREGKIRKLTQEIAEIEKNQGLLQKSVPLQNILRNKRIELEQLRSC